MLVAQWVSEYIEAYYKRFQYSNGTVTVENASQIELIAGELLPQRNGRMHQPLVQLFLLTVVKLTTGQSVLNNGAFIRAYDKYLSEVSLRDWRLYSQRRPEPEISETMVEDAMQAQVYTILEVLPDYSSAYSSAKP